MSPKMNLTEGQIAEFREAFDAFDNMGEGTITTRKLGTIMRSLGHNPSEGELREFIRQVDQNGTGKISFEKFLSIMSRSQKPLPLEVSELREAFRVFDRDNDGYLTMKELRHLLTRTGEKMADADADEFIRAIDTNGSGRIRFEDLVKILAEN